MNFDKSLEDFIYHQISKHKDCILNECDVFQVDVKLLTSILYVERIQYNLPTIRSKIHRLKLLTLDLVDRVTNPKYILPEQAVTLTDWINTSRGFSHIKFKTARYLYLKKVITSSELSKYKFNPEFAIRIACAILREHKKQWNEFINVLNEIKILSTLYNISNFKNRNPHPNPRVGGSKLPCIVDGKYIEDICFGERCEMVYKSKSMYNFWRS